MIDTPLSLCAIVDECSLSELDISPSKAAFLINEIINLTGYDDLDNDWEAPEYITPELQSDAIKDLSKILGNIHLEIIVQSDTWERMQSYNYQQCNLDYIVENNSILKSDPELLTQLNIDDQIPQINQIELDIRECIIPLIFQRLIQLGQEVESGEPVRVYKSDHFTASLKIESNAQQLSLDRNNPLPSQDIEALQATKAVYQHEFEITKNSLTAAEIATLKVIAQQSAQLSQESKLNAQELGE